MAQVSTIWIQLGTKLLDKNLGELYLKLDFVVKVRFVVAKRRCS